MYELNGKICVKKKTSLLFSKKRPKVFIIALLPK